MRKTIIISTILLISLTYTLNAQEQNETEKKPKFDVSFDIFNFVANHTAKISFSFDYLLNESESISITPTYELHNLSIGADYKHFFSKKYAQGFYTGLGLSYKTGWYYPYYNYQYGLTSEKYKALDVDFKLGYKLISKRNFFLDSYVGVSQTILGTNTRGYCCQGDPIKFGIKVGKRF